MKVLESNRLILRPWKTSDLDDLHNIVSNKEIADLAGFNARTNINESRYILNRFVKELSNSLWAIELKKTNRVVGWIELHKTLEEMYEGSKEIGFVLSKPYWGLGLMPEAIKQVLNYAFNEECIDYIICSHFENNIRSKKVIEKCGFKFKIKSNNKIYYYLNSVV